MLINDAEVMANDRIIVVNDGGLMVDQKKTYALLDDGGMMAHHP